MLIVNRVPDEDNQREFYQKRSLDVPGSIKKLNESLQILISIQKVTISGVDMEGSVSWLVQSVNHLLDGFYLDALFVREIITA